MEVTLGESSEEFFEQIFDKGFNYQATLKNGATVDMAFGYEAWETLNDLLAKRPDLIAAAQAKLRGEEVSQSMRRQLRRVWLTGRDGELLPYIRDVLMSGYKETNDGPVIANPFKLDTEADRRAFEAMEKVAHHNRSRFLRYFGLLPGNPGSPPPPFSR
jgi:hypothetical protein